MTVDPTKQDKIEAAKQAIEVTEAMQAINDDEVQLSLNEEQQILDSTESEEEAQTLRDAAILAKKSKVATQRAKTAVNKPCLRISYSSVPVSVTSVPKHFITPATYIDFYQSNYSFKSLNLHQIVKVATMSKHEVADEIFPLKELRVRGEIHNTRQLFEDNAVAIEKHMLILRELFGTLTFGISGAKIVPTVLPKKVASVVPTD